jgi:hypothetical protein
VAQQDVEPEREVPQAQLPLARMLDAPSEALPDASAEE